MVNVYVFRSDGTTPSGWSEIATGYRERLPLLGGTPLTTGGTDSHSHALTGTSVSSVCDSATFGWTSTANDIWLNQGSQLCHTHTVSTSSVGLESNLPPYKNFRLVYRSVDGWDGTLPAGSIVFREAVPASNYSRVDSGQTYFIRISATAGGTGGADNHNHLCSVTLANANAPAARLIWNSSPLVSAIKSTHGHNSNSASSSSTDFNYKYWGGGLISATSDTKVVQDSYLLFDGTPDSGQWEVVSADGCYLKALGTYTVSTGGVNTTLTHGHTLSMASSSANNCNNTKSSIYRSIACSHTHTITSTLDNQTIQPSYVRFILARAKVDFVTTLTVTYDFDTLVKKLDIDISADADLLVKRIDLPASTDAHLLLKRLNIDAAWSMSAKLIPGGYDLGYDTDVLLKKFGIGISAAFDLLQQKQAILSSFDEDMLLKKLGLSAPFDQDLLIRNTIDKAYSIDQLLKTVFDATVGLDMRARVDIVATYLMDLVGKKAITIGYAADMLQKRFDIEISAAFDLLQQKQAIPRSFDEDMLLKKLGLISSFDQNLLLRSTLDEEYLINELLKKVFEASVGLDMQDRGDIVAIYRMGLIAGKTIRLSYLAEALFYGSADLVLQADIIISDRPTVYRPLRRYPSMPEVAVGQEEVHSEPFDPDRSERRPRTYPEIVAKPPEPDVHHESFNYDPSERRNRQVKTTYR